MIEIAEDKDYKQLFQDMVIFLKNLGLTVNTNTKARGHQGFFLNNRIDVSVNLTERRKVEVLIHEFTHFIHSQIDKDVFKNHGILENLFPDSDLHKIEDELYNVTKFFEKNKSPKILENHRESVLKDIKCLDNEIKSYYSDFKRAYKYPLFDKVISKTDAKYLLKYDRVLVKTMFFGKNKLYAVKNVDLDFPELEISARNYIKIRSKQRALKRIGGRLKRLDNYYRRPTELFARFVEALFIDTNKVTEIAPYTYLVFCKELSQGRYLELADFINNFF